ncbi:MAG: hypothetical protein AAFV95_00025 [Bacteroidota bacterium]
MKNKKHLLTLIFFLSTLLCQAQDSEFPQFSNGLIYSPQTMEKLAQVVDSLNLKHKSCELDQPFFAKSQTVGHLVYVGGKDVKPALQDMKNQMGLEEFIAKYPETDVEKEVLVMRYSTTDYKGTEAIIFTQIDLEGGRGISIDKKEQLKAYRDVLPSKWIFQHFEKTEYSEEALQAFYFPNPFASTPLVEPYANMIAYADCLIDTSTTKFKEERNDNSIHLPADWRDLPQEQQEALLDEMRGTRVVGFCSQDNRPREHAVNIALLSAETTQWGVFLKAHLDIMNDHFQRRSDGNYAWGQRKTYLRELEELGINTLDILIGISLRMENPASNHYFGSIQRVGRAFADTQQAVELENRLLRMIKDDRLDDYNRVLTYFLFYNYNSYLDDENRQAQNLEKLKVALQDLPSHLSTKILQSELLKN